jgi:H+/Cl- antiporter ClcA
MNERLKTAFELLAMATINGVVIGAVVSAFALTLVWCNETMQSHVWLIYLLPFGGLMIVGLHKLAKVNNPTGTNRVIFRIHDNTYVRTIMAPLIFVSTLISQFFGASVGREAAALQIGGSLSSFLGKRFKIDEKFSPIVIVSGMSAAFSALFGTPLAASLFALELADCRISNIKAIIPSAVSSTIAFFIGNHLSVPYVQICVDTNLDLDAETLLKVLFLAILCALACMLFVESSKLIKKCFKNAFKNSFARIFAGGICVILITLAVGNQTYNGSSSEIIYSCLTETGFTVAWWACLLKILLTNVSLGSGYQGGEILPCFFIGATLGNAFSQYFAVDPIVASALGMTGLFAASTKCPLATLAISIELFGFNNPIYFILVILVSMLASGPFRIYEEQKLPWKLPHN